MVNQHSICYRFRLFRLLLMFRSCLVPAVAAAAILLSSCAGGPQSNRAQPAERAEGFTTSPTTVAQSAEPDPETVPEADLLPRPAQPRPVLPDAARFSPAVPSVSRQPGALLPAPRSPATPSSVQIKLREPQFRAPRAAHAPHVPDGPNRQPRAADEERPDVASAGSPPPPDTAHGRSVAERGASGVTAPAPSTQPDRETNNRPVDHVDRRVNVVTREEVTIRLDGGGWVFLGARDAAADTTDTTEAVTYRRRRSLDGATELTLRAEEPGSYTLSFQRQDLSRGTIERQLVALDVADTAQPAADLAASDSATDADYSGSSDPQDDRVAKDSAPDNPQEVAAAAHRALRDNRPDLAADLWRRNSSLDTPFGREARRGLFDLSFNNARYAEAIDHARTMLSHSEAPPVASLALLSDHASGNDRPSDAFELLQRGLELTEGRERDALLFRLARLYETDAELRNLRSSLTHYRQIVHSYPLSRYWEPSRERIEYLERHFFYLR